MKILFTTSTFPRWQKDTQATFVFDLAKNLQNLGVEVVVLAPHYKAAKKREILSGLNIYRFAYFYPKKLQKLCYGAGMLPNFKRSFLAKIQVPLFFISQLFWTFYLTVKERPDFIHAHWIFMQGFTSKIVSVITRKPLIITAHGTDLFAMQKGYRKWLVKFAAHNTELITVNSSAMDYLAKNTFDIKKSKIIPMGINTELFSYKGPNLKIKNKLGIKGPMILWVGRIVEVKGLKYAIHAFHNLLNHQPDAKLVVIGDGQEKSSCSKLAKKLNIEKSVIFCGARPSTELPAYFKEADIFLGTSIVAKDGSSEAFGIVYLEALASGTPVVATKTGGIVDIIKNENTGILVQAKNSLETAAAIEKVLSDRKLANGLSSNGRKIVEQYYTWQAIANKFKKIYEFKSIEKA